MGEKTTKEKFQGQKAELATRVKELTGETAELKAKVEGLTRKEAELQNLVDFMKNAGQSHQNQLEAEADKKQKDLQALCDLMHAKYLRKKKQGKDRKHALKAEIHALKRQLADALRQAATSNE